VVGDFWHLIKVGVKFYIWWSLTWDFMCFVVLACFYSVVESLLPDLIAMIARMLRGACVGEEAEEAEEAGARNFLFVRVKWLRPAMKGTSRARRLRARSFWCFLFFPWCSVTSGCLCVRSSMYLMNLWLQIAM
jgi:hypothetical protein